MALLFYFFILCFSSFNIRKQLKNFVQHNYQNRFNTTIHIEFTETHIITITPTSKSEVLQSAIAQIISIPEYFFIQLATNETMIIPKVALKRDKEGSLFFKNIAQKLNIQFIQKLNWKWM